MNISNNQGQARIRLLDLFANPNNAQLLSFTLANNLINMNDPISNQIDTVYNEYGLYYMAF